LRLQSGQTVGRYEVLESIGQGGMSESYRARDRESGQTVVLKVPYASIIGDPAAFGRYEREIEIGRRLVHPHIQRVLDTGRLEDGGTPYIVTEYVEGEPLRSYMHAQAPLPADEAVELARQLAGALQACHSQGVVHRDLKPENVLITPDGQLKLLDFGIALLRGARRLTWSRLSSSAGTPDYMAPEQIRGERGDARTDVYALGIMLFELLTGRVPYEGDNPLAIMSQHVASETPSLQSANGRLPAALGQIVAKATRRDPAQRYQSAAEFERDLKRWRSLDPHLYSWPQDRHRMRELPPALKIAGAVALVLIIVVIIGFLAQLAVIWR